MTSFKMLLFLFFLHLIKYSQKLVCLSMIIYFFFSLICLLIFALCIFVSLLLRCLMVYDVYLLCEFNNLSLKNIHISFIKVNKYIKKTKYH